MMGTRYYCSTLKLGVPGKARAKKLKVLSKVRSTDYRMQERLPDLEIPDLGDDDVGSMDKFNRGGGSEKGSWSKEIEFWDNTSMPDCWITEL